MLQSTRSIVSKVEDTALEGGNREEEEYKLLADPPGVALDNYIQSLGHPG